MIMADVLLVVFLILGLFLAFPGYWLLSRALFPRLTEGSRRCYEDMPVRTTLAGIGITVLLAILSAILVGIPAAPLQTIGVLFISASLAFALAGTGGLCAMIGSRLASPADEQRPWRATLKGGIVLELSFLLPLAGWFLLLPLALISGAGAATIALFRRRRAAQPAPQPTKHETVTA